jgi:hypothetical protein
MANFAATPGSAHGFALMQRNIWLLLPLFTNIILVLLWYFCGT